MPPTVVLPEDGGWHADPDIEARGLHDSSTIRPPWHPRLRTDAS